MSVVIFAGRADQPDNPWICMLCSKCDQLDRYEIGQATPPPCGCVDDNVAVIGLMGNIGTDEVWRKLTDAYVPDHVVGRVLAIMQGTE